MEATNEILAPPPATARTNEQQPRTRRDLLRDEKRKRFESAKAKFESLLPELMKEHEDRYAAVVDDIIEIHDDKSALLDMVIAKYGYRSMYVGRISNEPRVVRTRSPRLIN